VISLTITSDEIGVLAIPAKKPGHAHDDERGGLLHIWGNQEWSRDPTAPPVHPPITIEGPNTPALPPDPIVDDVVRILPSAIAAGARR